MVAENYLSTITKRDSVIFLGDVAFSKEGWDEVRSWPGIKTLILGNHDTSEGGHISYFVDIFSKVHGLYSKAGCWLSHAPIHPDELRGKFSVHGHCHQEVIDDPRYRNVCLEHTNFKPILFQDVVDELRSKNREE